MRTSWEVFASEEFSDHWRVHALNFERVLSVREMVTTRQVSRDQTLRLEFPMRWTWLRLALHGRVIFQ